MRIHLRTLMVAVLLMVGGSLSLQANSIVNGSFETPVVRVGGFQNFLSGSNGITGWTVVGREASVVSGSYASECCKFPAQDGNQWLDLTGDGSNSKEGGRADCRHDPGNAVHLVILGWKYF
jgi:hypothetical protein